MNIKCNELKLINFFGRSLKKQLKISQKKNWFFSISLIFTTFYKHNAICIIIQYGSLYLNSYIGIWGITFKTNYHFDDHLDFIIN